MPTKITLTIDDNITDEEKSLLRRLLGDAFAEYADSRFPVRDYVKETTPEVFGDNTRMSISDSIKLIDCKIKSTQARVDLAVKLRNATLMFHSEDGREYPILSPVARNTDVHDIISQDARATQVIRKQVAK